MNKTIWQEQTWKFNETHEMVGVSIYTVTLIHILIEYMIKLMPHNTNFLFI